MLTRSNFFYILPTIIATATVTAICMQVWQSHTASAAGGAYIEQEPVVQTCSPLKTVEAEGEVNYDYEGKLWLKTKTGARHQVVIQEDTRVIGIPIDLQSKTMSEVLAETGEKYPWYGLMGALKDFVPEGQKVRIIGHTDKIIAEDIIME